MVYDFNKRQYSSSGKKDKSGLGLPNNQSNQTKFPKLTASQYTGNELIPPLGEVEDSHSTELPSQIETPTEVANAIAIGGIGIGAGLVIVIAFTGFATLTLTAKDEKTGETVDIGTYTAQEFANFSQFTAQVSNDIWKAVGNKLTQANVKLEKFKRDFTEKFTKIIDENLGKIPGFDLDPDTGNNSDTRHTGNETNNIPQGTPPTDTTSGQVTREHLDTANRERQPDLEAPIMSSESENEQEQLPPIVEVNPRTLISRQTPAEMSQNYVNRTRKKIRKSGFETLDPIDVANIDGKLIIIDGHHRAQAAVREKLTKVPVRIYTVPPEKELEYLIQAAEAAEYGRYDRF
jgi:hypothetical protein